jgi:hypothetical protein
MGSKKISKRNQKVYRMKGCSKKTRKNYLGGSADINLAYPANHVRTVPNPFLAYTGKGGATCNNSLTPSLAMPLNTDGGDKTFPNTGPVDIGRPGTLFLNPSGTQRGGGCPSCSMPLMSGGCGSCGMIGGSCGSCGMKGGRRRKKGGCGPLCSLGFMVGGKKHRIGCKCSICKNMGGAQLGGNPGIPYPNGLVGAPWTPSTSGWPGVDGVQGGRNFIAPNDYKTDVQLATIYTGSQPPFSVGGGRRSRKQRGGALDNFLGQDLINLGRQFQFGLGSAYNALTGYAAPVNPLPWKGQLPNTPSLSTVRAGSL